jgi:hypothetical protein
MNIKGGAIYIYSSSSSLTYVPIISGCTFFYNEATESTFGNDIVYRSTSTNLYTSDNVINSCSTSNTPRITTYSGTAGGDIETCSASIKCGAYSTKSPCRADNGCKWDGSSTPKCIVNDGSPETICNYVTGPECRGDEDCEWDDEEKVCFSKEKEGDGSLAFSVSALPLLFFFLFVFVFHFFV